MQIELNLMPWVSWASWWVCVARLSTVGARVCVCECVIVYKGKSTKQHQSSSSLQLVSAVCVWICPVYFCVYVYNVHASQTSSFHYISKCKIPSFSCCCYGTGVHTKKTERKSTLHNSVSVNIWSKATKDIGIFQNRNIPQHQISYLYSEWFGINVLWDIVEKLSFRCL